jgi:rhodanese-related sulfurtransferase
MNAALALLLLAAVAAVPAPAAADHRAYGVVLTIDPASLKQLVDEGKRPVPIDLRPAAEFGRGHLPGARSVPVGELRARLGDVPRGPLLVLYTASSTDDAIAAYHFLRARGYPRLFVLEHGLAAWRAHGYPVER